MIRIDIAREGSRYRVRVHEHVASSDDRCCPEAHQGSHADAYPDRDEKPRESRQHVLRAVLAALTSWGHVEFLAALEDRQRMF